MGSMARPKTFSNSLYSLYFSPPSRHRLPSFYYPQRHRGGTQSLGGLSEDRRLRVQVLNSCCCAHRNLLHSFVLKLLTGLFCVLTCLITNFTPQYSQNNSDPLRVGRSGDRIPVVARFSAPVQTGSRVNLASYTMGTGSFSGLKRPGFGVDHPPPNTGEVEGRVEL